MRRYQRSGWLLVALVSSFCLLGGMAFAQENLRGISAKRMQACTTCHGAGATATVGRTANEAYFPRIAGKPSRYLFNQLQNYRDGRRYYGLMVGLVEHQSDEALMDMARYFAQLDLPYPEPQAPPAGTSPMTLKRGEQLALHGDSRQGLPACASCHGPALMGVQPHIAGLLGLPRDYIAGQIGAWQTGMRKAQAPDCMAQIARKLSPEDVHAVATWLASQRVSSSSRSLENVGQLGKPMPASCGGAS